MNKKKDRKDRVQVKNNWDKNKIYKWKNNWKLGKKLLEVWSSNFEIKSFGLYFLVVELITDFENRLIDAYLLDILHILKLIFRKK